jgi:hypothetical protein
VTGDQPDLDSELAAARLAESAMARRRRRNELDLQEMETTMRRVLAGAAASRVDVVVESVAGRRHPGAITGVGHDVVTMRLSNGGFAALRLDEIAFVESDVRIPLDERPNPDGAVTMTELVAGMAGTRETVTMWTGAASSVTGEVEWCGEDVVCVVDRSSRRSTLVYLASVSEVTSMSSSA